jgi:DNA gyrase subunit A
MAKNTTDKDKLFEEGSIGHVEVRDLNQEMQDSYLSYAMSVIVSRALPDVRDGMKPVHRRILYVMNSMGLRSTAKYRKSAQVVGEVMGKYHPHGDAAIYDTMARMAQNFSMRYMLVDGQGNFGSIDGDSPAAMRYTEARMAKLSDEILSDIDKETVDFNPNYDGTLKEPSVLPTRLPALLLNGTEGIAVGMATKIPPHNLSELIDGITHLIDNPEATVEDLMKFIKGPDFPTGGLIYDNGEIKSAYGTGKGGIVMRAVAEIEEEKRGFRIVVSEIPYQVNKATLIEKISDLVRDKKIVGISDIRDESDRKHMVRIVIELKKDAYPNKILNQLYKLTPMQCSFYVNMIALIDQIHPQVLTLKTVLEEFIKHRQEVVRRRSEYELRKAKERAHILEGLLIALGRIDEVIATIKKSASQEEAKVNLMNKFKLSEVQSLAILAMQLRTLAGLERQKIQDEFDALQKKIKFLEDLLASVEKMLAVIKEELSEIKEKYGDARRTKIIKQGLGKFNEEDLIPNEQVVITLTSGNYVKRVLSSAYRSQARGGKGVMGMSTKEEDVVEQMAEAMNHDDILFFTNKGRIFQIKAYEIPASSRTAKGQPIVNLLQLAPEENITAFVTIPDINKEDNSLVMATKYGTVKKTAIKAFANIRKTGIIAITLDKGDELGWVKVTTGKEDIVIVTALSQAIRFNEKEIRPMGRSARGVRGMKLRKDDYVIGMDIVIPGSELVVITENGFGKRTAIEQFTSHHRGGVGIKAGVVTSKTGRTVDIKTITSTIEDLIVISKQGTIIRTPLKNISKIGRATQGVRIMKLGEGDLIASIASIPKVKEEEEQPTLGLEEKPAASKETNQKKAEKPTPKKAEKTVPKKPVAKESKKPKNGFKVTEVKKATAKKPKGKDDKGGFKVKKIK